MMNSCQLLVNGYYGCKNTGDDALVASIVWGIKQKYPLTQITICSDIPLVMPENIIVNYHRSSTKSKVIKELKQFFIAIRKNYYIYGGGSVFDDRVSTFRLKRQLYAMSLLKLFGCKNLALGVSLGPIKTSSGINYLKRIINKLSYLYVRDIRSFQITKRLNIRTKISFGIDPAILIGDISLPKTETSTSFNNGVVVAPCDYKNISDSNVHKAVKNLVEMLNIIYSMSQIPINLVAFNGSGGDFELCNIIKDSLSSQNVTIHKYNSNPKFMYEIIKTSKIVIGMRLHSIVYAYAAQIPYIGLKYHEKVEDFNNSVGGNKRQVVCSENYSPADTADLALEIINTNSKNGYLPTKNIEESKEEVLSIFNNLGFIPNQ